jgi:hypothetical protein
MNIDVVANGLEMRYSTALSPWEKEKEKEIEADDCT